MDRIYRWFKMLLLLLILVSPLIGTVNGIAKRETQKPSSFKTYEHFRLVAPNDFGKWTRTEIYIPKGSIVGVMARGEIWDIRRPDRWRWQPVRTLRVKIGEEGTEIPMGRGIDKRDPFNLTVIHSRSGGYLYVGLGAWWRRKDPASRRGEVLVRVLLWEEGCQDRVEEDLIRLIREHPKDHQFIDLVGGMAICFGDIGEYQRVENLYKMMADHSDLHWDRVRPSILSRLSDFEAQLGRYEKAKSYLKEVLKGARQYGDRYMESRTFVRMGRIASSQGNYEEAHRLFEQSLQIAIRIQNPEATGSSFMNMGLNRLRMNRPTDAVEYFEKALEQFHQRDSYLIQRWCYLHLGKAYLDLQRDREAKRAFESAIEIAVRASDPQPQWSAHRWLGVMAEREGDQQKAFEHYAKGISIIETLRAKYRDPSLKTLFMKDKTQLYERMIQLLYHMKRFPEAFHYLERLRARVMLDMLAEKALVSKNREENELLIQERRLRRQIEEAFLRGERVGSETPSESIEGGSESQGGENPFSEMERLQSQYRALLERIEKRNHELASLLAINPLKANEVQSLLDPDTVMIQYFIGTEHPFVFILTPEKVLTFPLKVESKKIFQKIKEFRERTVEGITWERLFSNLYKRPLRELYEILIQPIWKELSGKRHLIIVAHRMLHYLPFQALMSEGGKYLIESFTISYLPSASVLKYTRAKNRGNRGDLFAVGNPRTELPPLPIAEVEVREVSTLFEKKVILIGEQATETLVKRQVPQYDLIHFSTHGEMNDSSPLQSNLRLTHSEMDDGRLTVSEIFDLEIRANLVTLSACETGLAQGEEGGFPKGDDLIGLSRAFIHAGAPSVVASLWKVSDDSTVKVMREFYQNMKTLSKAEALRQAQLDLMRSTIQFTIIPTGGEGSPSPQKLTEEVECFHPFFWAPFILLGDWR